MVDVVFESVVFSFVIFLSTKEQFRFSNDKD